jgi:hypothetical protein
LINSPLLCYERILTTEEVFSTWSASCPVLSNGNLNASIIICFLFGACRMSIGESEGRLQSVTRVEAGSNTSTVTLRVVGGDEKEASNLRQ